jgi:hypothetical protein
LRPFLVIPGILLVLAGFTFTLQGLGMVGPKSSFMFQSTTWIYEGFIIFLLGLLLTLAGTLRGRSSKDKTTSPMMTAESQQAERAMMAGRRRSLD